MQGLPKQQGVSAQVQASIFFRSGFRVWGLGLMFRKHFSPIARVHKKRWKVPTTSCMSLDDPHSVRNARRDDESHTRQLAHLSLEVSVKLGCRVQDVFPKAAFALVA